MAELRFRGRTADDQAPPPSGNPLIPSPYALHYADRDMLLDWLTANVPGYETFDEVRIVNNTGTFHFTDDQLLP